MDHPFTFAEERCQQCGACTAVCPARLLQQAPQQPPRLDEILRGSCLGCGHCAAVCPQQAWSLSATDQALAEAARPTEQLHGELAIAIKSRRTVREFTERAVPQELVASLIATARYAPTAGNAQDVGWLVLNSPPQVRCVAELAAAWFQAERDRMPAGASRTRFELLSQLWAEGRDVVCRGAPGLIVVHSDEQQLAAAYDCALALGYFDLLAWSAGLGACWGGFVLMAVNGWAPLREHLALPPRRRVFGAMMYGFPRYRYPRIPERRLPSIEWRS